MYVYVCMLLYIFILFGASLSEPHTYRIAGQNPLHIYNYICTVEPENLAGIIFGDLASNR